MKNFGVLFFVLLLAGCAYPRPDNQRLLMVCEAWRAVFQRVDARDQLDLASDTEIDAINDAILVLNPICTGPVQLVSDYDIFDLEQALLDVLATQGKS